MTSEKTDQATAENPLQKLIRDLVELQTTEQKKALRVQVPVSRAEEVVRMSRDQWLDCIFDVNAVNEIVDDCEKLGVEAINKLKAIGGGIEYFVNTEDDCDDLRIVRWMDLSDPKTDEVFTL